MPQFLPNDIRKLYANFHIYFDFSLIFFKHNDVRSCKGILFIDI